MKYWSIIASILLAVSVVINVFLLMSLGINDLIWEEDYAQQKTEWCELVNDYSDVINDLVIELQAYNSAYSEIQYLDQVDCWSDDE